MKFKYGDEVKVTDGFYEGLTGEVTDRDHRGDGIYFYFETVHIDHNHREKEVELFIHENKLEKVE